MSTDYNPDEERDNVSAEDDVSDGETVHVPRVFRGTLVELYLLTGLKRYLYAAISTVIGYVILAGMCWYSFLTYQTDGRFHLEVLAPFIVVMFVFLGVGALVLRKVGMLLTGIAFGIIYWIVLY